MATTLCPITGQEEEMTRTFERCEGCGQFANPQTGHSTTEPVTVEERRAMGDDMLYPTYNIFGEWEN